MKAASPAPPETTLFIDRDAWSRTLGDALNAAGISFVAHHQRFRPDAPDAEWLSVAGQQRWMVLTRDQHIRRRPNELEALKQAGVLMFVLSQGNLSAVETAEIVVAAYPRMVKAALAAKRPAIFTVTRAGRLSVLRFR